MPSQSPTSNGKGGVGGVNILDGYSNPSNVPVVGENRRVG